MEALSPTARIVSLRDDGSDALAKAVVDAALALGMDEARARQASASSVASIANLGEGDVVVAPLRTPWGDVLDVVASSHTPLAATRNIDVVPPRGDDWTGEITVPSLTLGPTSPALTIRALRFRAGTAAAAKPWPKLDVAAFVRPYPGQTVSGDATALFATPRGVRVVVADALGHGENAAKSALGLLRHLSGCGSLSAEEAVASAHRHRAANPRGAAAVVFDLDFDLESERDGEGAYVGIGNIEAIALGEATRPISRSGTVGLALPRLVRDRVRIPPGSGLAIATDGLILRWASFTTAGVAPLAAPFVLGIVLATAERRHDDATVLVIRRPR